MLQKTLSLSECEIKFADGNLHTFTGYASVFDVTDRQGDRIVKGAYAEVIKAGAVPKMYIEHGWIKGEIPIGKFTELSEDDRGLIVQGEFTPGNVDAEKARAALQHETIDALSVGIMVDRQKTKTEGNVRYIEAVKSLPEISLTAMPANESAKVDLTTVKSALAGIDNIRDFEQFLRDTGHYSKSSATAIVAAAKAIFADRGEPEEVIRHQRLIALSERLKSLSTKI